MSLPVLTENSILNIVYALYEGDTTNWSITSAEYLSARIMANASINRWEFNDQTNWRELWVTLTAAADGTKTTTAGTYTYTCPTDMIRPASWVRVDSTYWTVVSLLKVPSLVEDTSNWCYFTGSIKAGFKLNFNSNTTLPTGATIEYEYYKVATTFTAITSTTEMSDPYFIVYFVLSRLYESDGEDSKASKAFQEAEGRLEAMKTQNMLGLENIDDLIPDSSSGFGT